MLNLKKTAVFLAATFLFLQNVSGLNFRAEAATYPTAMQGIMSGAYPIVMGNEFSDKYVDSATIQRIAKDLSYVSINRNSDLFCDIGTDASLAQQIHAINPNVKVLQYLNLIDVWSYEPVTAPWIQSNNAALKDDSGNTVYAYQSTYGNQRIVADPQNTNWQNYDAQHAKSIVSQGMDGIMSDNWMRSNWQNWNINATRFEQLIQNWNTVGQMIKSAIGTNSILIGNSPAWPDYQNSRDVDMIESNNAPNEEALENYFQMSDQAASYNQANQDTIDQSITETDILNYYLPACLLTDNVFGISNSSSQFDAVELVGKIGRPLSARYTSSGILQRDFTGAKVLLNNTPSTVAINLPAGVYKDLNGNSVNSITLGSFKGAILKGTPSNFPDAPSNLTTSGLSKGASTGAYYVTLNWTDNSTNETGFNILQAISVSGSYNQVATAPANNTSCAVNIGTNPPNGTYFYQVQAYNLSGVSKSSNTISTAVNTPPAAPSNLAASSLSKGDSGYFTNLTWTVNSANQNGFKIYESIGTNTNYQVIKNPTTNAKGYGINIGKNPTPGIYYFKVSAVNSYGESSSSNEATVQYVVPPAAPSNLTTAGLSKGATSGNYYVNLSWTSNSTNETGFNVYQSIGDQNNFKSVATAPTGSTSYATDIGQSPANGTYYYKITSVNTAGESQATNIASAQVNLPPASPSNLTVSSTKAANGNYQVTLTWTGNSTCQTGYEIDQSLNSTTNFQSVNTPAANATSTTIDLGANPTSGTYNYQILALNSAGKSQPSNTANVEIIVPPAAPSNLTFTNLAMGTTSGNYYVNLSWTSNSTNETGFNILQSSSATGPFTQVATAPAGSTTCAVNMGQTPVNGTYYYQVQASNTGGTSQPSNTVSALVNTPPAAPSNLTAGTLTKNDSGYFANLVWTANSTDQTGFKIYQSISTTDNYQVIKTPIASSLSYGINIGNNPANGTYYYKITAVNANGESQSSNVVTVQVGTPPVAPSNLTTSGLSKGATTGTYYVNLNWSDNGGNETGFNILQSSSPAGPYTQVATASAGSTSYAVNIGTTPVSGNYYYQVQSYNSVGASQSSNTVTVPVNTPPAAPSNLTLTSTGKDPGSGNYYANISWKNNAINQTGFKIYQSVNSSNNYQVIKTPAASAQGYGINIGSKPIKGTYYYKVTAVNTNGESQPSNIITATIQ